MRRHISTREGIVIESAEKSLQAKPRSNVTLYMHDVYATTRGGACGGTWNLPNQMTGRGGDISNGVCVIFGNLFKNSNIAQGCYRRLGSWTNHLLNPAMGSCCVWDIKNPLTDIHVVLHGADSTLIDSDLRRVVKDLKGTGEVILHASPPWKPFCHQFLGNKQLGDHVWIFLMRSRLSYRYAATSGRKSSVSGGFGLTGMTGVVERPN